MAKKVVKVQHFTARIQSELHSRILDAVEKWQKDWCLNPESVSVTVAPTSATETGSSTITSKSDSSKQLALLNETIDWKLILFGDNASQAPKDEVYTSLIGKASQSFFAVLYCAITGEQTDVTVVQSQQASLCELPKSVHSLGTHTIRAQLTIGDVELAVRFPLTAIGQLDFLSSNKPRSTPRKPDIKDIACSIQADVSLAFGTHRVSDICNLDIGDILISNTGLDELLSISIGDSALAKVRACRRGGKKAIMLVQPGK